MSYTPVTPSNTTGVLAEGPPLPTVEFGVSKDVTSKRSSQKRKAIEGEPGEIPQTRKKKLRSPAIPTERDIVICLSSDDENTKDEEARISPSHSAAAQPHTIIVVDSDPGVETTTTKNASIVSGDDDLPDAPINVVKDFHAGKHIDEKVLSRSQRALLQILRTKAKETPEEARKRMAKRHRTRFLEAAPIIVKRTKDNPHGLIDYVQEDPSPSSKKKRTDKTTKLAESSSEEAKQEQSAGEAPQPKQNESDEVWWVPDGNGGYKPWSGGSWQVPNSLDRRLKQEAIQENADTWTAKDEAETMDAEATNVEAPVRKRDRRGFDWEEAHGLDLPGIRDNYIRDQAALIEEGKKGMTWKKRKDWIDTTPNAIAILKKKDEEKRERLREKRRARKERERKSEAKLQEKYGPDWKSHGKPRKKRNSVATVEDDLNPGGPSSADQGSGCATPGEPAAASGPEGEFDLNDFDFSDPGDAFSGSEYESDDGADGDDDLGDGK